MLYRSRSEHARACESFIGDFERSTTEKVEKKELDSKDGARFAELYDIVEYPAIVVTRDDGEFVRQWAGTNLPPVSEVAGAARS